MSEKIYGPTKKKKKKKKKEKTLGSTLFLSGNSH